MGVMPLVLLGAILGLTGEGYEHTCVCNSAAHRIWEAVNREMFWPNIWSVSEMAKLVPHVRSRSTCVFCRRCTNADAMHIVGQRIALQDWNEAVALVLLEVDAASEVLEKADEDVLEQAQSLQRRRQVERSQFVAAFSQRRREVCPKPPAAKGTGKGKNGRGGGHRGRDSGAPKHATVVDQSTAKLFAPHGASIWRGRTRQEWCGHMPPQARIPRWGKNLR